ncbi:MAG: hypothetical protein F7B17_04785 [Desulfurococcales archaeon]|nr:hypothetical protein [Desulfurococcales archaeon]
MPSDYLASLLLAAHWLICGYIHVARPEVPIAIMRSRLSRMTGLASTRVVKASGVYMVLIGVLLAAPSGWARSLGVWASLPLIALLIAVHSPRSVPRGLGWDPWEYATFARILALTAATITVAS